MRQFFLKFITQLSREFLRRLAYGSVVGALLVKLVVSSSGWKAAGTALGQADLAATEFIAALLDDGKNAIKGQVAVVAIDDAAYGAYFQAQSPLNPRVLQAQVEKILKALPVSTVLVLDLDVSPHWAGRGAKPTEDIGPFDHFWIEHKHRVVLVQPAQARQSGSEGWVRQMRSQGVQLGRADLPQNFGLVDFKHDWPDSLSALAKQMLCRDCAENRERAGSDQAMSMVASDPDVLAKPVTVLFREDTPEVLRALAPKVVILGGTWGADDVFQTPFGSRYGVHLHAAKMAGHLKGHRTAPAYAQVLMAIFAAALSVTLARMCASWLATERGQVCKPGFALGLQKPAAEPGRTPASLWTIEPDARLQSLLTRPSASFMAGSMRRMLVMAFCMLVLLAVFTGLAVIHHAMGIWFPSLIVLGFGAFAVTSAWVTDITRNLQIENPIIVIKPIPAAYANYSATGHDGKVSAPIGVALLTESLVDKKQGFWRQFQQDFSDLRRDFILPLKQALRELWQHLSDLRTPRPIRQELQTLKQILQILLLLAMRTALPAWAFISLMY